MLPDPLNLVVDTVPTSFPRGTAPKVSPADEILTEHVYNRPDGDMILRITQSRVSKNGYRVARITLSKAVPDVDAGTVMDGIYFPSVTMEFRTDPYGVGKSHIAALRTTLSNFLTEPMMNRLIAGEA